MTNADNERVDIAESGSSPGGQNRRRSDAPPETKLMESLKARLSFLTDSRFLEIVLPLLGGLGIAILTALIMKYV
jgi:hypothetical protein